MKALLKSIAAAGLLFGAAACNTVAGIGEDTEYVGDRIKDASETVEEELND